MLQASHFRSASVKSIAQTFDRAHLFRCADRAAAALYLLFVATVPAVAQEQAAPPKAVQVVRTDSPIVIDGRLDERAWQEAGVVRDLLQIRPVDGALSSERTEVYLLFDKDALYVGARMWDAGAPDEVTANIMKQGSTLAEDDRIAVVIDPFNTGRNGYRFEVNANAVRNDMLYKNNQLQTEWSVIWDAAATLGEGEWIAEFAIPFKSLPFDPTIESWGFNVSRAIRRRGEEAVWVSRNRTFNPSIVGVATGFSGLDQGVGLDVVPTLAATRRKSFVNATTDTDTEPSLDVYYRITPSLTGSLTFNTDFSATEVDDRQVNLTRFNLFFPEKRDFFLNDADLFEFGRFGTAGYSANIRSVTRGSQENGRPFFSRRIGLSPLGTPVDLDYGGKLSGRVGRFTVGALAVRQDEFVPPTGPTVEPTNLFVGRATMDVLSQSSLGFIGTAGNPQSNLDNSLVGMDFQYLNTRLPGNRTLEGEVWYQQSDTDTLEGDDSAFGLGLRMPNSAGLRGGLAFREIEQNFFPALGFTNRVGIRDMAGDLGYTRFFAQGFLQSLYAGVDGQRVTALTGDQRLTQIISFRPLELESRRRDTLKFIYTSNDEHLRAPFTIYNTPQRQIVIPAGAYSFNDYGFDLATGAQRRYSGKLNVRRGDFYDGERLNLGGEFLWKPSRHLNLRLAYDWNSIELPQGDFITRLTRVTAETAFSSRLIWINLLQYDDVSEIFGIHSRLQWIPRAGQVMFLVLNRSFEDFDKNDSFNSITSELSVRASYTFRF